MENIWLIACVRIGQRCNQSPSNTHDGTFDKNSKVNWKTVTILAKRLILVAWMGPGLASKDEYITVLKIQTKDGGE